MQEKHEDPHLAALTYAGEDPNIPELRKVWENTTSNLDYYFQQTRRAYDNRRCYWPGKNFRGRKEGADAFPWQGASDQDAPIIQERILKYVSIVTKALNRSHIKAFPVGMEDIGRSRVTSIFLKWLQQNGIANFAKEASRAANYWFEKGLMVTHVGWLRKDKSVLQSVSLDQIRQSAPEVAEMIGDKENDGSVSALIQELLGVSRKRALKAVRQLRSKGEAEIPFSQPGEDRPEVCACAPDCDVFFPPWTVEPQKAPYFFFRRLMTAQEILSAVATEGWDKEWADHVIANNRGISSIQVESAQNTSNLTPLSRYHHTDNDLIEVLYMYQRLHDEEDGSEGIYRTIFCASGAPEQNKAPSAGGDPEELFAKRELMSGCTDYPLVVTRLIEDEKRLYDIQNFCDLLRSAQKLVKDERDGRIDGNSLRNVPPLLHKVGRPPVGTWGPRQLIGVRRNDDFQFGPVPNPNPQSVADEQIILDGVDRMIGLDQENQASMAVREYFVEKFLDHHRRVLSMAYDLYQKYGPEEMFFRITGHPDLEKMEKKEGERLDISITFDTMMDDADNAMSAVRAAGELLLADAGGRIDRDEYLAVSMELISPYFSQRLIKPADESQREFARKVADDLTRIHSGIEVNAQPNGAAMAIPMVQQWASQPDIAADIQQNPLLQKRLEKYVMQYVFQQQQQQNAMTGRLGTPPAAFDVTQTTGVGQ